MSNRACIQPTKFVNIGGDEDENSVTLGVRVYDEYDSGYINTWNEIPKEPKDILLKVLKEVVGCEGGIADILGFVNGQEIGLYIGDEWYPWEDVADVFAQVYEQD